MKMRKTSTTSHVAAFVDNSVPLPDLASKPTTLLRYSVLAMGAGRNFPKEVQKISTSFQEVHT